MAPSSTHSSKTATPPAKPAWDAKALLNPKAAKASSSKSTKQVANPYTPSPDPPLFSKSTTSTPGKASVSGESQQEAGMGSMIEKMHNVERREYRPIKRQKQAHEEDNEEDAKKKTDSGRLGGSGDMGGYLKEKRKEALEREGPSATSHIVDLTNDDDDASDGLTVTADTYAQEVCLGRIENARVNAHKVPTPKTSGAFQGNKTHWPPIRVTLQRRPGPNCIIAVADPMGHDFANIDQRVATALVPLMDGSHVTKLRIQARLDGRPKKAFDYPGQAISDSFLITLNLYAPRKFVPGLGKWLSQRQIWLREPLGVDNGVPIVNPHAPKDHTPLIPKSISTKTSNGSTAVIVTRTQEEVRHDVFNVFDNLREAKDLPEIETPSLIITPLLAHQKQALYFMRKREKLPVAITAESAAKDDELQVISNDEGSNWRKKIDGAGRVTWLNVITGHSQKQEPSPTLGGILADVMGLGKTLNILALIMSSLNEATTWSRQQPPHPNLDNVPEMVFNSKGTLLLCPLSTVVNWEDQIKAHIKFKSITYCIYQGPSRTTDPYKLRNYDIVISTYGTAAADLNPRSRTRPNSPLFEINWFRIVLDEAHVIRKQTTLQSKAACMLSAGRRWCVSGTPVQNRLDDIGALIKFLRIKPFDEGNNFSQFISTPLRTGDPDAIPKLRLLVDSITLRRLKDKVDLPERVELVVKLQMSDPERKLYDFFTRDAQERFAAMTGQNKGLAGKSMAHILRTIGRLRMLCVHGQDMLSDEDWDRVKGLDPSHAIDLEDDDDERPDRTAAQAFEMYRIMKDATVHYCAKCQSTIGPAEKKIVDGEVIEEEEEDEDSDDEDKDLLGYLMPCNQLICPNCIDKFKKEMKSRAGIDNYATCPFCDNYIRVTFFPLRHSEMLEDERAKEAMRASAFARNLSRYNGPSTKVAALLADLAEHARWSEENPDERPIKSVVFSEWVTMLDLMQYAFVANNIKYTRLDGKMSFSKRTTAITSFMTSTDYNVILVSLHAGGLGLNLTAASNVYVMEPNYNPAAEAQAVERVHRLGQTRKVVIKKFVIEDSIEEKVLVLQQKKLSLAEFSVDRDSLAKMTKEDSARKKLEDLRTLLR